MMVTPESNRPGLEESACFLVRKITGGKMVEAHEIKIGIMTFKFLVTLSTGQKYIVRFYPRSRSFVVRYEPDIIGRCQAAGLPAPEVICDSRNGPRTELEYMIYPFINGTSLSEVYSSLEEAARMKIADQLVPLIAKISEIALEGFGELLDGQRAKLNSWSEFLEQTCHTGIVSARRYGLFSERDICNLESLLPELTSLPPLQSGRLVWGDISLENLIVEKDGSIAGILDFEGALSGDHLVNLGFCHARCYGTGFFEALIRAWPERFSEDQQRNIKLYSLLRALRLAKFAHLPLPTGVPSDRIINVLPGFGPALYDLLDTSESS